MSDQLKDTIETLGRAFEEFKAKNDERIKQVEAKGTADVELTATVDALNERISELQAKVNRQSIGTDSGKQEMSEKMKAFQAYARRGVDPQGALSVGTDSAGGYTVPDEFERQLIQALEVENVMRGLATVITSSSGLKEIPVVSAHGSATWTAEAAAHTESDETFANVTLSAYKVSRLIKVSKELLNDSAFNLEGYLSSEFGRSIGAAEEAAFVSSAGSTKPTGIVDGAGTGKTGATGQTTSVTTDDLIDLYHSLGRPYRRNGTWLMADGTAKAVRKLKDTTNQYLWQPGLVAGQPDSLLGRPVVISDNVPAMAASAKSIVFADCKYYWIADRTGFSLQRLSELYAANGQVGFIGERRVDGKLTLAAAAKVYVNSAT